MSNLPKLTVDYVRQWTDRGSFNRGRNYYNEGRILHPRLQGMKLKGQCWGSVPKPYRMEVTLNSSGIISGVCSCPVGYACKHTVALLLTWIHEPEAFTEEEELDTTLERFSKDELITLIKKMLDRAPEMEDLLQIQALSDVSPTQTITPDVVSQQVAQAMSSGGYDDWGASYNISQTLFDIVALGDSYAGHEDWHNAATVYATAARAILDNYASVYDEEGEILMPVGECVVGLGQCLEALPDNDAAREDILRAVFEVENWDLVQGGLGMTDEAYVVLVEQTTPNERAMVAEWVREVIPSRDLDNFSRSWRRQAYGRLLLDLEGEQLDEEAYLQLCRETDQIHKLVRRLLDLERVDEAADVARSAKDYDLFNMAPIFVEHDKEKIIYHLIKERAETSKDTRLKDWLKQYAQEHNNPEEVLALAQELFWMRPSVQGYQELCSAAQSLQRWDAVREATLKRLAENDRYTGLRIEIYLAEENVALALQTLKEARRASGQGSIGYGGYWGYDQPLHIRVAQAAESEYPDEAIEIYLHTVNRLIAARGRNNYATAAQYLLRVREIYNNSDKSAEFSQLIKKIREDNSRLPAMQDEFDKAGL